MEKIVIKRNYEVVGEVYYNQFSRVWVAQLACGPSQSFLTKEKAIEALTFFDVGELSDSVAMQ